MKRALSHRLNKLESKVMSTATDDPRWRGGLPLFVLFDGEELVGNPLPNLEPLVVRLPGLRSEEPNRFNPIPERYRPYVVTK